MKVPPHSCLIVIDMQKDFLDDNGYYVKSGKDISPMKRAKKNIEDLIKKIKVPIIFIKVEYEYEKFGKGKSICVFNTAGSKLVLDKKYADKIIKKKEHDSFTNPQLAKFLEENKIKIIFVVGVTTENCVIKTALSGIKRKFDTIIIKDCVATNKERMHLHTKALQEIKKNGGTLINSSDLEI